MSALLVPACRDWPLPYVERLQLRPLTQIERLVVHCTELPDLAHAREYGERRLYDSGSGNSGHYYIDRDGGLSCFVPPEHIAHHVRGHNADSIGIELINIGRWPHWLDSRHQCMREAYPAVQIEALLQLVSSLRAQLPNLRRIAGHEDLDREQVAASDDPSLRVPRKRDPGPLFPWPEVLMRSGLEREQPLEP